jgi:multicomponent Na+:H+ antiporter subunit G
MNITDAICCFFLLAGAFFFFAGTVGLVRFPDVYTRLHTLTKADNIGLGLIVFGLSVQVDSFSIAATLFFIWGLVMLAGTTCCHLIAQAAHGAGIQPWSQDVER